MKEPLISVIIPIYNMELYLERCMDSVLNNTYHNLEVICVDDGSKDGSLEILRRYAAADSRIVVIAKENGGVSSARNAGLDRMTGEYVCFIDPDDYVHPQYVELLYRSLSGTEARISICGYQTVDASTIDGIQESYSLDPGSVSVLSIVQIFKTQNLRAYCWGKLFLSELVSNRRFREDLRLAEDTAFVAEVCERAAINEAAVLSYPLYFYFQRDDSAVKVAKTSDLLQFGQVWTQTLLSCNRDDIYLDKALKWYLSVRYLSSHIYPDRDAVRECNRQLMTIQRYLPKTIIYGKKEKAAFLVFIRFPLIYWLHRVISDPSMWQWEMMERWKRREVKRKGHKSI